ncbi:hypothetical protein CP989_25875, partial [Enterobacter hormaechei]|uniref:hypothetical protein n=1 Tax=Enterobacter hormaechei TaxID=158836 RepID=UPI000BC846B6
AQAYMVSYQQAIHAIGKPPTPRIYEGPGISIKLSALHPRYSRAQYAQAYMVSYQQAIHAIGKPPTPRIYEGPGISIK